jgi:hypothetical protein
VHITYHVNPTWNPLDPNSLQVGEEKNDLVARLRVGVNFAIVITPNNYVDFFILQCVKKLRIVEEDSRLNDWGNFV